MLQNKGIMEPLLEFCIGTYCEDPKTDLQWVAALGTQFCWQIICPYGRGIQSKMDPTWPDRK